MPRFVRTLHWNLDIAPFELDALSIEAVHHFVGDDGSLEIRLYAQTESDLDEVVTELDARAVEGDSGNQPFAGTISTVIASHRRE